MYRKIFDNSRSTPNFVNLSENITLKVMPYSALKRRELFNFLNFFSGRAYTCTFPHNYMKMYIHNFSNMYRREYIRDIGFSSKIYVLFLRARSSNSTILIIPIFRTAPVPKYLRLHHCLNPISAFIFNGKIYSLCQNNSIPQTFFFQVHF